VQALLASYRLVEFSSLALQRCVVVVGSATTVRASRGAYIFEFFGPVFALGLHTPSEYLQCWRIVEVCRPQPLDSFHA
jgi:hypothetical protein